MAVPSLAQLFTALSRDDVMAAMLEVAAELDLPVTAYESGSVGRELLTIFAQAVANNTQTGAAAAAGGLLDYATGDWLTLLCHEVYAIDRIPATFATGQVTLTNTSSTAYPLTAGGMRVYAVGGTANGATYTSTSGGTLAAHGTLVIDITADQPGSGSSTPPATITGLATPLLGVTASNDNALFGVDEESDTALRSRARASLARLTPNGPVDAYTYYAESATRADGTPVGITRVSVTQANGTVYVYVANGTGAVTGNTNDPLSTNTTDLGIVAWAIQQNCVPTGITAHVASATNHPISITGNVYLTFSSSETADDARNKIEAQLVAYFATIPIGGFSTDLGLNQVYKEALVGQIYESIPGQIVSVVLTTGDTTLLPSEVATLTTPIEINVLRAFA